MHTEIKQQIRSNIARFTHTNPTQSQLFCKYKCVNILRYF